MSENATPVVVSRVNTVDGAADRYDHAISMIDTVPEDTQHSLSQTHSWRELAKRPTRNSLKEHAARRKYAKWRHDRYPTDEEAPAAGKTAERVTIHPAEDDPTQVGQEALGAQSDLADFAAGEQPTARKSSANKRQASNEKRSRGDIYEIDILYENQRGAFLCGIPLYSHSSLLNFDPGPWVTKDFKDSAVNITNAQVPDPSWEWAWKTWYVDMSHDVDEEGWEYSFSFGKTWSWHGTHPWFHSFVRRRRWLRKRVKRHDGVGMSDVHKLNGDYFTIHSKRDQSPARPESYVSHDSTIEVEETPEEIKDIPTLLRGLRLASIDREKVDVVKRFVKQGGEEMAYLRDNIPEIMSFLVFQNSKRQLLGYLQQTASEAWKHREEHDAEHKPEGDAETRRINNILAAVEEANKEIGGLEYWSDRKHVLNTVQSPSDEEQPPMSTIFDKPTKGPRRDEDPVADIKGIPESAELSMDPAEKIFERQQQSSARKPEEKGKAREAMPEKEDEPISGAQARDREFVPDH